MIYRLLVLIAGVTLGFAQFSWQDGGLPIRQGVHIEWQRTGDVSEDGSMIIAWSDTRNAIRDIYAQKIDSDGNYLWGEGGAVVADFEGRQEDPLLVRDGNGGAYIIWRDYRDENYYGDIYGQHIDANGNRLWDPNGVPLSNQSGEQSSHNLCVDGNGGAYALWVDKNGSGTYVGTHLGPNQSDIIAQGVGVLVSSYQNGGFSLEYAGNGEAVMVWTQSVDGDQSDLRAQRINQNMESLWNDDGGDSGKTICDAEGIQSKAKVTTFNDNNVAVVWRDLRNDPDGDVYAQILDESGNPLLSEDGIIVCDDTGQQASPRVKTDGVHAFIYWEDKRFNNVDPFVQKMDTQGNLLWTNNGVQVISDPNDQDQVRMTVDNNGGAFFAWIDGRGDDNIEWAGSDIYLEHISSSGDLSFAPSGLVLDQDSGPQVDPLIKCNQSGEAYVIWNDRKEGSSIIVELQKVTVDGGTSFTNNGQEVWYGVDGNALLSSSLYIEDGQHLVAWEDNRYLSTGHPGSYTYGLSVNENMNIASHQEAEPLCFNPFQGPHGGNYDFRAKLAKSSSSIMMNFHQYDGPYRQYYQMLDYNLDIIGSDSGQEIDSQGNDQKYSGVCTVDDMYYLAYSSLDFAYGIFLQKYNADGIAQWSSPINIVEASFEDNLVKAVIPNPINGGIVVIYESASFMGVGLNAIFVDENGASYSSSQVCSDCNDPQYESYASGDNEFIVTYKSSSSSLSAGVYAQVFSFDGNNFGNGASYTISDEVNDQRSSRITYNQFLDEYLACWNDGRETFNNEEGEEIVDLNILCANLSVLEGDLIISEEIEVAAIEGSQQQNPSVFSTQSGNYMIGWEDMRSAQGIDQSLNLSFEWDAYYQEINSNGIVYEEGGIPLSTDPFGQVNIRFGVLSEEDNLYLAFWEDDRSTGKELLTNIYAQLITPSDSDCTLFDVNADSNVDVLDVVQMVNIVLGNLIPDNYQSCAADVNSDDNIDVLDVVSTVNAILNP